jgi:hypothetical protein
VTESHIRQGTNVSTILTLHKAGTSPVVFV